MVFSSQSLIKKKVKSLVRCTQLMIVRELKVSMCNRKVDKRYKVQEKDQDQSSTLVSHSLLNIPIFISGGGNGNPFQFSCLENPMDRGTWWAVVHGVARS